MQVSVPQNQVGGRAAPKRKRAPNALGRAIGYLNNHRRTTAIALAALLVATVVQLLVPQLIQSMFNYITDGFRADAVLSIQPEFARQAAARLMGETVESLDLTRTLAAQMLLNTAVIVVAAAVFRGMFAFVQTYMAETTSQGLAFDFRNAIFSKISRLSFSYYDRNQTGQLMIRATSDVENLRLFIAQGLLGAVQAFLLLTLTLVILFFSSARLALVVVAILPLTFIVFAIFGRVSQPLFAEVQRRLARLNTVLQENVAGIKVVRAFVRERQEAERFYAATDALYSQQLLVGGVFSALFPLIFLIAQAGTVLILGAAADPILRGEITIGEYQAFTLYLALLFIPLGNLGFIVSLLAQASASAERIFEILDAESDVKEKPDALHLETVRGDVTFEHVTFRYFNSGEPVLKDVSFSVKAGQTVALLGSTGSGKTTVINLIPRFYDVTKGRILIDGHDVRDLTLDSLRSHIGIVLQETNLFSGTIRDNIAFGRPDATDEEVIEAAKAAAAHDFIMSFPDGYNTLVGERGSTLSGGQKQRIAIARALLLKPSILILDDSTSAVDFATEAKIQKALDRLMQGRTSFVIAQRISTVRNADLILVLDKGQLVASGTHVELLENSPVYAEIFNSQLVGDAEPDVKEA
jgi:ATP-binding cassette subfamily B multidrug efflux pump